MHSIEHKDGFTITTNKLSFELSEYEKERVKEKIFCFSMSEHNNEEIKNNLSLWLSFAQDV